MYISLYKKKRSGRQPLLTRITVTEAQLCTIDTKCEYLKNYSRPTVTYREKFVRNVDFYDISKNHSNQRASNFSTVSRNIIARHSELKAMYALVI